MNDEEDLHRFGTPLQPLEKDEVPAKKKPIAIEDQIVKDENGKRRFHGAFTGGFSAGFWNTVGSLEGWTPQSFKSSRSEKAQQREKQRPEDFMDHEDLGEFGIAPQGIRTRDEFSKGAGDESTRKRKLMQPNAGPIPGAPVLEQLLKPVRDKVAVRILKSMGWKPGQGVGPRQTRKEKKQSKARNKREQYLLQHYGCDDELGMRASNSAASEDDDKDSDDGDDDEEITFAPDDYEPIFYTTKDDRYGLSYTGLSREPVLSKGDATANVNKLKHINLFGPLEVLDKHKKLSIAGQAFGVGALEEEDDDIYARDDMTRYDFTLGKSSADKQKKKKPQHVQDRSVINGFAEDNSSVTYNEPFTIDLPRDYKPRNWQMRRSRFAPMEASLTKQLESEKEYKKAGLGRHDLNPIQRAQLLGEEVKQPESKIEQKKSSTAADRTKELLERIGAKSNNFTRGGLITSEGEEKPATTEEVKKENAKLLEKAVSKTNHLGASATSNGFKPFLGNEAKQTRYEQFLTSNLQSETEITEFLKKIQPVTLSAWDREMELKEFMQARSIYKPLAGIMSDRFVSEAAAQQEKPKPDESKTLKQKEIVMERTKCMWKPTAQLCKRYNIAEPFGGAMLETEKPKASKTKLSVFDYLETSVNTKSNFQTPVIIPKHVQQPTVETKKPIQEALQNSITEDSSNNTKPETVSTATKNVTAKFVPKTELEKRVEESKDKPISEKTELFKSIFDDSDEEEQEQKDKTEELAVAQSDDDRLAAMRAQLGLPGITKTKSAAASNVLRNDSPPRGIFAALFNVPERKSVTNVSTEEKPISTLPPKIAFKTRAERQQDLERTPLEEEVYGPKIPENIKKIIPDSVPVEHNIDEKLKQLWMQQKSTKQSKSKFIVSEQWVEKRLKSSDSDSGSSSDSSSDSDSSDVSAKESSKHKKDKKKKSKKTSKKLKKSNDSKKLKKKKTKKKSKKYDKAKDKKSKKCKR